MPASTSVNLDGKAIFQLDQIIFEISCLFYLSFHSDFYVSKIMLLRL